MSFCDYTPTNALDEIWRYHRINKIRVCGSVAIRSVDLYGKKASGWTKKCSELLNDQINKELYSAYLYMDFANYYEEEGLAGFANWYMIQAQEERDDALKFRSYLRRERRKGGARSYCSAR